MDDLNAVGLLVVAPEEVGNSPDEVAKFRKTLGQGWSFLLWRRSSNRATLRPFGECSLVGGNAEPPSRAACSRMRTSRMFDMVRCSLSATSRRSSLVEGDMRRLMASDFFSAMLAVSEHRLYDAQNVTKKRARVHS